MRRVFVGIVGLVLVVGGLGGCGVQVVASGAAATGAAVAEAAPPGTGATGAGTATAEPTMPPVRCSSGGIRFAVVATDAAMGLRVLAFDLVNCGRTDVTVSGYPDIRVFDAAHRPAEITVEHGSGSIATVPEFDNPPTGVTLQPGERARSGLVWRNLVTDADLSKSVTAHYLEATAGDGKPWVEVPLFTPDARHVTIDLGNTGKLGVQAWHKA